MLKQPFYHQLTKKYVNAFGTLFNEITLVRMDKTRTTEIERMKVPIRYGPQEKWLGRITGDADFADSAGMVIPMMSFEITGRQMSAERKRNPLIKNVNQGTSTNRVSQYTGVPYDLTFELNIYAKTTDDANQIVEQILPTFSPDYNITNIPIESMGFSVDVPVTLQSINENIDYEGDFETVRVIQWTLVFNMQVHYWGPVSTTGLIRRVHANTYMDPTIQSGATVRMNLTNGNNGVFKIDSVAFQGPSLQQATAAGIVLKWDATNQYIRIGGAQGTFKTGAEIYSAESNAVYTVSSFDASPLKLVHIKVEPDPIDANPDDDFGYDITITEYPDIE